jgi:hypothetical protein
MDWVATVPIDLCYFLRLRILLNADLQFRKNTGFIRYGSLIFLVIPVTWITVDVIGILSIFSSKYNEPAVYIFGIWNIGLALNEMVMHSFFVIAIIQHIRRRSQKGILKLSLLSAFVIFNSGILLAGGLTNIFNTQIGATLAYSSWLVNIWVFLALNETVTKINAESVVTVSHSEKSKVTSDTRVEGGARVDVTRAKPVARGEGAYDTGDVVVETESEVVSGSRDGPTTNIQEKNSKKNGVHKSTESDSDSDTLV